MKTRNIKAVRRRIKKSRANRELTLKDSMARGYAKIHGLHSQMLRERFTENT